MVRLGNLEHFHSVNVEVNENFSLSDFKLKMFTVPSLPFSVIFD